MIIDFNAVEEKINPNFKGGEKAFNAKITGDALNKIIHGRLEKGASIGLHTHETNSEIIYRIMLMKISSFLLSFQNNKCFTFY